MSDQVRNLEDWFSCASVQLGSGEHDGFFSGFKVSDSDLRSKAPLNSTGASLCPCLDSDILVLVNTNEVVALCSHS